MKAFTINHLDRKVPVRVIACKKPAMTSHKGRTWDQGKIMLDGEILNPWLDTSWGEYLYFPHNGFWYKTKMFGGSYYDGTEYDIDPFGLPLIELITK